MTDALTKKNIKHLWLMVRLKLRELNGAHLAGVLKNNKNIVEHGKPKLHLMDEADKIIFH